MGDMGSDKSSQQNTSIANQQVTQSGRGQIGVSGSTVVDSNITVYDGDVEVAKDALELAHQGINFAAVATLSGQDLAENVVALNNHSLETALATLDRSQDRALHTVDAAVEAAQETAKNSTAIPQSTLSEKVTKEILIAAVVIAAILALKKK